MRTRQYKEKKYIEKWNWIWMFVVWRSWTERNEKKSAVVQSALRLRSDQTNDDDEWWWTDGEVKWSSRTRKRKWGTKRKLLTMLLTRLLTHLNIHIHTHTWARMVCRGHTHTLTCIFTHIDIYKSCPEPKPEPKPYWPLLATE